MDVLTLSTGFYVGYIKDKLLEKIQKYLKSNYINDRGTTNLTITAFGKGETIQIQHTSDGEMFHHKCNGLSCMMGPSVLS